MIFVRLDHIAREPLIRWFLYDTCSAIILTNRQLSQNFPTHLIMTQAEISEIPKTYESSLLHIDEAILGYIKEV